MEAARRKFSPEFMNRMDKVVVFHPLRARTTGTGSGHRARHGAEAGAGHRQRANSCSACTDAGRDFLLQEGTDQRYGARHLKRAIERYVVYPLANLLATQQVRVGDLVRIDWDGVHKELTFVREQRGRAGHARKRRPRMRLPRPPAWTAWAKTRPLEAVAEETARPAGSPGHDPGRGAAIAARSQERTRAAR